MEQVYFTAIGISARLLDLPRIDFAKVWRHSQSNLGAKERLPHISTAVMEYVQLTSATMQGRFCCECLPTTGSPHPTTLQF